MLPTSEEPSFIDCASASVTAILTPDFGSNAGTLTVEIMLAMSSLFLFFSMPYTSASRLAPASTKSMCIGSVTSNVNALGHFLGPDQKGLPEDVT